MLFIECDGDIMYIGNFWVYNEKSEIYNDEFKGDYWKFVDASDSEIDELDLYYPDVCKICCMVHDDILREKMRNRLFNLLRTKGVFFSGEYCLRSGLFSSDEIKYILDNDSFNSRFNEKIVNWDELSSFRNDVIHFVQLFLLVDDFEWQYSSFVRIIDFIIKGNNCDYILVNVIELAKKYFSFHEKLVSKYYDSLPIYYKNFLKIDNDRNFINNNSLKFVNSGIRIGIDPKISIGPEIEANHYYGLLFDVNAQYGYDNYCRVSRDATVPDGIEVSCMPFHDTNSDVSKFCSLCESLSLMGYYYDDLYENAGGQINLGLDYLDSARAIINFYEIFGNCEELLFYISNEVGQLTRQEVYVNSRFKPISEIIGTRVINEDISRDEVISLFKVDRLGYGDDYIRGLSYKKNTVCLRGNDPDDYRLEIRIPNGGVNYSTWIDNIRLYGKIMEISKKIADFLDKDYLSSSEERLLKLKIDLSDKSLSLKEKLIILMDLLFDDEAIKKIYFDRYNSVLDRIDETHTNKYNDFGSRFDPAFDTVDFQDKYSSMLDSNGDIIYDPDDSIFYDDRGKHVL